MDQMNNAWKMEASAVGITSPRKEGDTEDAQDFSSLKPTIMVGCFSMMPALFRKGAPSELGKRQ